jgi:hypothetical protein
MQNKKPEKWNRLTGPLDDLIEHYDNDHLKTIGPDGALAFFRAASELIEKLGKKRVARVVL